MVKSIKTVHELINEGRILIEARKFRDAHLCFMEARERALSDTERAYAVLGVEECELHLRLAVEDGGEELESALSVFTERGDHKAEAWAHICLGIRKQATQDLVGVIDLLEAGRAAACAGNDREAEARALLDIAAILTFRRLPGDADRMMKAFERGYDLAAKGDAYERTVSEAARGIVRYTSGDLASSASGYRAATEGFSSLGMPEQALETSVALGVTLLRSGAREEAERTFRKTAELGSSLDRNIETGVALMYLGQMAEGSGRFSEAFSNYSRAEDKLANENHYGATLRLGQARALCAMGRYAEVAGKLDSVAGSATAAARISIPMIRAMALSGAGKYTQAIREADIAVEEASVQGMPRQEAEARAVRMDCLQACGDSVRGMMDADAILGVLSGSAPATTRSAALRVRASAFRTNGDVESAIDLAKKACSLLVDVDAPLEYARDSAELGRALADSGDSEGAGEAFRVACTRVMEVRKDAPESYRRDFLDSIQEIFAERIRFLVDSGDTAAAYREALRLLARTMTERFGLTGEEEAPDPGTKAEFVFLPLGKRFATFVRTARGLTARLIDSAELLALGPTVATMSDHGAFRGFSIKQTEKSRETIDQIAEAVAQFREALRMRKTNIPALAAGLYEKLIAPAEFIAADCPVWVICPGGAFAGFPFEALEDSFGKRIIEHREIVYTKSPLLACRAESVHANSVHGAVLAVGDPLSDVHSAAKPLEAKDTEAGGDFPTAAARFIERAADAGLPPLPGAAREAEAACMGATKSELLIGANATKRHFLDCLRSGEWDTLHIAAHALYAESGKEGAILFHPDGDNILSTQEIASLSINVRRVVLSACASALGKPSWSEGAFGLVGAFLEAGAKTVYATLWRVRDLQTAGFMERMYTLARESGLGFDDAFAECKRLAASGVWGAEYADPALWASFVRYGL